MRRCLGISPQAAIDDVITALTSDSMIAPSFWVDPKTGNNYLLTVQYPDNRSRRLPTSSRFRCARLVRQTRRRWSHWLPIKQINTPTEVDHYQLRRSFDIM